MGKDVDQNLSVVCVRSLTPSDFFLASRREWREDEKDVEKYRRSVKVRNERVCSRESRVSSAGRNDPPFFQITGPARTENSFQLSF